MASQIVDFSIKSEEIHYSENFFWNNFQKFSVASKMYFCALILLFVFFLRDTPELDTLSVVFFLILFIFIVSMATYRFLKSSELLQDAEAFGENFKLYDLEEREKKLNDCSSSRKKRNREIVSEILLWNFRSTSPKTRENVLKKISLYEEEYVSENTARILSSNFMDIPKSTREEILLRLSEKKSEEAKEIVSEILLSNFKEITENLSVSILSKFSHEGSPKIKENAVRVIYINFQSMPKDLAEKIILDSIRTPEVDDTYIKAVVLRYGNSLSKNLVDYATKKLNF